MVAEFFTGVPIVVRLPAIPQPELSPTGNGYIYFDSGLNQFMMSENGGAYVPLGGGGGGGTLAATLALGNTTGANDIVVSTGQAVRGAAELLLESNVGNLLLEANGGIIDLRIGGTSFWQVNAAGHLISASDNANSIGLAGANRPSTVNVGTSVVVGTALTVTSTAVTATGALSVIAGAASDLSLSARGAATELNQAGETSLDAAYTGAGRTSIIGALNALVDGTVTPTASALSAVLAVGNTTGANNIVVTGGQKIVSAAASALTLDGTTTLDLQTGAATRWQIQAAPGHLMPQTGDNTQDIGDALSRIRTLYAGTSVVVGSTVTITTNSVTATAGLTIDTGAASTLNLGNTNATTIVVGMGTTAITAQGDVVITGDLTVNGTTTTINTTNLTVTDALIYGNDGGIDPSFAGIAWDQGAALDVIMVWNPTDSRIEFGRFDTTGGTTVPGGPLTTLSDVRVNNVSLDGTAITADGILTVTATGSNLNLAATGANEVNILTNGTGRWIVNSSGHLLAAADSTYNIGGIGSNRPQRVYVGTEVVVGNTITIGSSTIASSTTLAISSANGTGGSAGSALSVLAGAGDGVGAGGSVSVTGGGGGATGNGGTATLSGGVGGGTSGNGGTAVIVGGTPAEGNGGSVQIDGATGVGTDRSGGDVIVNAGGATGTGTAGSIQLSAGGGGSTSAGGLVTFFAGQGGVTNGNGGTMSLGAGDAQGTGTGGQLNLSGGASPTGTGGEIRLQAGNAALADRVRILPTGRVSIGSSTPLATLDVQGSFGHGVTSISAGTTADDTAVVWLVDASGGAVTLNLPTAASALRRIYHIKKTDASVNAVTIDADGAETIDGATTQTLISQYESIQVVSDGTEWFIL